MLDGKVDDKGVDWVLPGYVPMGGYRRNHAVYVYWVHSKDGAHFSGGIDDDGVWQKRW